MSAYVSAYTSANISAYASADMLACTSANMSALGRQVHLADRLRLRPVIDALSEEEVPVVPSRPGTGALSNLKMHALDSAARGLVAESSPPERQRSKRVDA